VEVKKNWTLFPIFEIPSHDPETHPLKRGFFLGTNYRGSQK
jgi:hypothetical protein